MKKNSRIVLMFLTAALAVSEGVAQSTPNAPSQVTGITLLEQWKSAVLSGDAAGLKALYGTAAHVKANSTVGDAALDTDFWLGLKARSIEVEIIRSTNPRPDIQHVIFRATATPGSPNQAPMVVADDQVWQKQSDQWRLVSVARVDAPQLKQPSDMKKEIYHATADAHADLEAAEQSAMKEHKRVLLVFGANWCYDCHVLDLAFQRPELASVLAMGYEVVHVDIGPDGEKNADLAKQFDVPLNKGIPALAVVESDGKLVVSQKNGEFENARALTPSQLLAFLQQWLPDGHGAVAQ